MSIIKSVTIQAPINIAVIKYWGKKDEKAIIPLNNSISATLSVDDLCATTTITCSNLDCDQFWLNGVKQSIEDNKRLTKCLEEFRKLNNGLKDHHFEIRSFNNFPTAAGLASSAAGYACLVSALGSLFGINDKRKLSIMARQGSGSACRSVYGGFVEWQTGIDSQTSFAEQIVDEDYWSDLRVLILIVNDNEKDVASTSGMQRSVETSDLLKYRAEKIVPERCRQMREAIKAKDFHSFAELTMRDSNQFHAICQDTFPPIRYMNDISWSIVALVHGYNKLIGKNKVAYTFDAGLNAVLFMEKDTTGTIMSLINYFFPRNPHESVFKGQPVQDIPLDRNMLGELSEKLNIKKDALKGIIHTRVGGGPRIVPTESS